MKKLACSSCRCSPSLLPLAACGGDDESDARATTTTLTVYAAASLTSTFEEIADEFEAEHDGVEVELSFGGSSDLVTQIQEGAPADVFASADTANMDKLVADDLTGADPEDFATNTLEIAVPPGNPAGITTLPGPRRSRASTWSSAPPRCRAARPPRRWPRTPASR